MTTKLDETCSESCNSTRTSFASGDVLKSVKQPSERRLEEEALSRMDDEGGSNDPAVNPPDSARAGRKAAPNS